MLFYGVFYPVFADSLSSMLTSLGLILSLKAERFHVTFLGHGRKENSLNMKVKYRFMFLRESFQVSRVKVIFVGIKIEQSFSIGRTVLPMFF